MAPPNLIIGFFALHQIVMLTDLITDLYLDVQPSIVADKIRCVAVNSFIVSIFKPACANDNASKNNSVELKKLVPLFDYLILLLSLH